MVSTIILYYSVNIHLLKMENVKIIAGRSNPELTQSILMSLDMNGTSCVLDDFYNGEIKVQVLENLRGKHIYIIQSGSNTSTHSPNDFVMELALLIDACRRSSAGTITVIIPCFPYARSDKKDAPRTPIGAKVVSKIIEKAGATRLVTMDMHSGQTQGYVDCPFDNLYGAKLIIDYLTKTHFKNKSFDQIYNEFVLVSPDNGGIKRVTEYQQKLKIEKISMWKERSYKAHDKSLIEKSGISGDVSVLAGKTALLIDDIIDSAGTMCKAVEELVRNGAKDAIIIASHGFFSGPAINNINKCDAIKEVVVINTLPQNEHQQKCSKIKVIDAGGFFAEVIKRLAIPNSSISELFE